jgi:hypothetical protein
MVIWLLLLLLLLLLRRRRRLPGIAAILKMIGGWGRLEVVLGVDKGGELVGKVLVLGVHFHRSMLVGSATALLFFAPLNQMIN